MSDVFEGPGWWMASDARWYPPHLHADPAYRAKWASVEPTVPEPAKADPLVAEPTEQPAQAVNEQRDVLAATSAVALRAAVAAGRTMTPGPAPVAPEPGRDEHRDDDDAGWSPLPLLDDEPSPAPDTLVTDVAPTTTQAQTVSDDAAQRNGQPNRMPAPVVHTKAPEVSPVEAIEPEHQPPRPAVQRSPRTNPRPVSEILGTADPDPSAPADDQIVAAEVSEAPERPPVRVGRDPDEPAEAPGSNARFDPAVEERRPRGSEPLTTSRARLEVGTADRGEERFGLLTPKDPSDRRIQINERAEKTTDLVHVPRAETTAPATLRDRLVATLIFASGIVMIVASILFVWVTGPNGGQTGWDLRDGIATIIAGVLGSAAAGPIFVGFRHVIPKALAIFCGLIAIVIPGIRGLEVLTDAAIAMTDLGLGWWVVVLAGLAMTSGGLADTSSFGD